MTKGAYSAGVFGPGVPKRLSIVPDAVRAATPGRVCAGVPGGGQEAPGADGAGKDTTSWAIWGALEPIYPPHLQLACSVLYDRLPTDAATLPLALYQQHGGFAAVAGHPLDPVLAGPHAHARPITPHPFLAPVQSTTRHAAIRSPQHQDHGGQFHRALGAGLFLGGG